MEEVEAWVEQEATEIAARMFARFRERAPRGVDSVGTLLRNIYSGLSQSCATQHVEYDDIARTIPIETGYIGTGDFANEPADKQYLRDQGRMAVERFAKDLELTQSPSAVAVEKHEHATKALLGLEQVNLPGVADGP